MFGSAAGRSTETVGKGGAVVAVEARDEGFDESMTKERDCLIRADRWVRALAAVITSQASATSSAAGPEASLARSTNDDDWPIRSREDLDILSPAGFEPSFGDSPRTPAVAQNGTGPRG